MISHIPLSPSRLIHDLWTDRMRGPKLDQQVVEVIPLLTNWARIHINVREDVRIGPQGDPLEVLGFDGLERLGNPLDAWPCALERQVFEFRGSGEVERGRHGPG